LLWRNRILACSCLLIQETCISTLRTSWRLLKMSQQWQT